MPLFGKSQRSPADLVKNLRDALDVLENSQDKKKTEKASDDVAKCILAMKSILYGSADQEPQQEVIVQLSQEMYTASLFHSLILSLPRIDFERKKDVTQIFNNLLRRQVASRLPTVEHLSQRPDTLILLLNGYDNQDIALHCGLMLRECLRYESLAKIILTSDKFFDFFTYVEMSTFDISSDAFSTFKDALTKNKALVADFLNENYERFFTAYQNLLNSENYVTRRQALKLLGELLLDRHNFSVMTQYISNEKNLKLMMNMLREKSKNIQFEAFHVFKVFVANPNKREPIRNILLKNQDRLVEFLTNFHTDRSDDEQFNDEKAYLIKQIRELRPAVSDGEADVPTATTAAVE